LTSVSEAEQGSLDYHNPRHQGHGNTTYPMPYEPDETTASLRRWCPVPLLQFPLSGASFSDHSESDDVEMRPPFQPCLSPCSARGSPQDCCTGPYNSPEACEPSDYSKRAKDVCPDAYSFAYDDVSSTFVLPSLTGDGGNGGGWEVVFCPRGRSTNILRTFSKELQIVGSGGVLGPEILERMQNGGSIEDVPGNPQDGDKTPESAAEVV
jgi:hypothetical protein